MKIIHLLFIFFSIICSIICYHSSSDIINPSTFLIIPTMILGAFVAGSSPLGGGVVAFPVMSYLMSQLASTSSIYSLAIQSFGMTSASLFILKNNYKELRWDILIYTLPFSFIGIFLSKPIFSILPSFNIKLFFSSFWLGCGICLWNIYKQRYRKKNYTNKNVPLIAILIGFLGGVVSFLIGSGADFFLYMYLVLFFDNTNSKSATLTSVVQMAFVSVVATLLNINQVDNLKIPFSFLSLSIPVVIFFAPLGSKLMASFKDETLEKYILFLLLVQYLTALIVLKPSFNQLVFSLLVILMSSFMGMALNYLGKENKSL